MLLSLTLTNVLFYEQANVLLTWNKILYKYQQGYKYQHSTDPSLTAGLILIDLRMAFHLIDQDIILKILRAFGFSNHFVDWFKSYLSNRLLRVNLEKCYSYPLSITYGVPQGSILTSLLFLIYVDDMS